MAVIREDPYGNFNFIVEVSGLDIPGHAGFSEASGLDMEITPIEYRAGNDKSMTTRKIPGLSKCGNVTLKRGVTGSMAFYEWMREVHEGSDSYARNVTIALLDEARNAVVVYRLQNAWPVKFNGPDLNATGNAVAIESFELAHEGLTIE